MRTCKVQRLKATMSGLQTWQLVLLSVKIVVDGISHLQKSY